MAHYKTNKMNLNQQWRISKCLEIIKAESLKDVPNKVKMNEKADEIKTITLESKDENKT